MYVAEWLSWEHRITAASQAGAGPFLWWTGCLYDVGLTHVPRPACLICCTAVTTATCKPLQGTHCAGRTANSSTADWSYTARCYSRYHVASQCFVLQVAILSSYFNSALLSGSSEAHYAPELRCTSGQSRLSEYLHNKPINLSFLGFFHFRRLALHPFLLSLFTIVSVVRPFYVSYWPF
jgi:hypothetical protein